jgi:hypothetical protein
MARMTAAALTLVELLVATALGMLVIGLTWTAFARAKSAAARTTARVAIHQSASILQEAFARDLGNLAPALALFANSASNVSGSTKTERIEIVFMRSVAPLDKQAMQGTYDHYMEDNHWVRWLFTRTSTLNAGVWGVTAASLKRSSSSPARTWQTTSALTLGAGQVVDPLNQSKKSNYGGAWWINIPRPLRDAGDGVGSLDNNRYGVPATSISASSDFTDIGDLADLIANEQVVSTMVQDFMFSWVQADGDVVAVDTQTPSVRNVNGLFMDVVGPDNGRYLDERNNPVASPPGSAIDGTAGQYNYRSDLASRPRLFRIAMRLEDASAKVSQVFTFSVAAPGLTPPINTPAP